MENIISAARTAISDYDTTTAWRLLLQPALGGDVEARRLLTTIADEFDMLFNVEESAFTGVQDAADGGNAFAQYLMSRFYRTKQVDIRAEVRYATMSADQGDGAGLFALSQCYKEGRGVACLKEKAEALRKRAVELEHPAAMVREVRLCLAPGREGYDEVRGMQLLRRCMELQIAESYSVMAELHSEDRTFVPLDLQESERLFRFAASAGYPQAYYHMAYAIGFEMNPKEHPSKFEKMLQEGMAHNVPLCFYEMAGRYKRQEDITEAVACYERAAELGYMEACDMLGYMYEGGHGVEVDLPTAWKWYSRGAEYYEPNCLSGICGMIEPDRLSRIIRPVEEEEGPYDAWYKQHTPAEMLVYKERLAMTGAQGAADAAYWLYEAYCDASQASSELMNFLMYGDVRDGHLGKDGAKAMGYIHRAAELNQNPKYALIYGLLATQGNAPDIEQGIAQLEQVMADVKSPQMSYAVMAAVRLAELYSEGKLVKRDPVKALRYRHDAVLAGYEASLDPVRGDSYESASHALWVEQKYGTKCIEQARAAMRRFDVATAFALLIEPALDDYFEAKQLLATIVSYDENLRRVPDEAFEPVRRLACGNGFAAYLMARYYSVKRVNLNLCALYASESAEHSDGRGCYELSNLMAMTSMSEADEIKAHEFAEEFVKHGNFCALLHNVRERLSEHPTDKALNEIRLSLRPLMEEQIPESYSLMAMSICADSEGDTAANHQQADELFKQALSAGYPQAYCDMAVCTLETVPPTAASTFTPQGLQQLDKGIELGIPSCIRLKAQHFMAYNDGRRRDIHEAIRLYKMAAAHGDTFSMSTLGDIFSGGHDVEADPAEAWRWYALGADHGDAKSLYCLGQMCIDGNGAKGHSVEDGIDYLERALLLGTAYGAKAAQALFCLYGSPQLALPEDFDLVGYDLDDAHPTVAKDDALAMKYLKCAADMCFFPEACLYYGTLLTTPSSPFADVAAGIAYLERAEF